MTSAVRIYDAFSGHEVKSFSFSGGERQVRLPDSLTQLHNKIVILARITSPGDILDLLLTVDALKRRFKSFDRIEKTLYLPYLPYSRQDRVCANGEALSISVFAKLINSLNFTSVVTFDCHSDVGTALIENCINIPQEEIILEWLQPESELTEPFLTVIAPDSGASKKAFKTWQGLNPYTRNSSFIQANKERNPNTGEIVDITIPTAVGVATGTHLVVDDLCDGGRTFIELAKNFWKRDSSSLLYVTHGIFSNGFVELLNYYDKIYCTDTFSSYSPATHHGGRVIQFNVVERYIEKEFNCA